MSSLQTGFLSNLKLICGDDTEFLVHKLVLCSQSDFFHKACSIDMKASYIDTLDDSNRTNPEQEKHEGVIRASEDSSLITSLLHFCYSGDYQVPEDPLFVAGIGHKALHHAMVYVAADKYGVPALMDFATVRFKEDLSTFMNDRADSSPLYIAPSLFKDNEHREQDVAQLFDAISYIYEHTTSNRRIHQRIRQLAVQIPWHHKLLERYENAWANLLEKAPEYAVDLTARLSKDLVAHESHHHLREHSKEYACHTCDAVFSVSKTHRENEGWCPSCGSHFRNLELCETTMPRVARSEQW